MKWFSLHFPLDHKSYKFGEWMLLVLELDPRRQTWKDKHIQVFISKLSFSINNVSSDALTATLRKHISSPTAFHLLVNLLGLMDRRLTNLAL